MGTAYTRASSMVSLAEVGGPIWLVVGAVVFGINVFRGKGVPELAEEAHSEA